MPPRAAAADVDVVVVDVVVVVVAAAAADDDDDDAVAVFLFLKIIFRTFGIRVYLFFAFEDFCQRDCRRRIVENSGLTMKKIFYSKLILRQKKDLFKLKHWFIGTVAAL